MAHAHLRLALLAATTLALMGLSGCITDSSAVYDGTRPADGELPPTQVDGQGIVTTPYGNVHVALTIPDGLQPGQVATWHMTVTHEGGAGDERFPYSSICHAPWQVALHDDAGHRLAWSEPLAECEAYGTAYLEPGESLSTQWDWNVRQWNDETEAYEDLGPGDYALTFTFERQDPEAGNDEGPSATHLFRLE